MAEGSTALKVISIILIIIFFMILACAGVGYFIFSAGKDAFEAEMARQEFAANWKAPAEDVADEELFPQQVGAFKLSKHDNEANVADFNIEAEGRHGEYSSPDTTIQVYAYRLNSVEADTLVTGVQEIVDDDKYNIKSHFRVGNRLTFSISPPKQCGYLWHSQGWLFFFHAQGDVDLGEFSLEYLPAIEPK